MIRGLGWARTDFIFGLKDVEWSVLLSARIFVPNLNARGCNFYCGEDADSKSADPAKVLSSTFLIKKYFIKGPMKILKGPFPFLYLVLHNACYIILN